MSHTVFLEPLNVLFLRGNKAFGDPGSFGEALVPPWPSVVAGALRSRMLAEDKSVDLAAFARGEIVHPTLGSPEKPGSFTVTAFHLARKKSDGVVELLIAPPADLTVFENDAGEPAAVCALRPTVSAAGLQSSTPLVLLPVLGEHERRKPALGYWLTEAGWKKYLAGTVPDTSDLVKSTALWSFDYRVGVGLEASTRRAADGRLFSMQAVAMCAGVGFLASVAGAEPPTDGTVRLGGDGGAAAVSLVERPQEAFDFTAIAAARRCRLVLTTPGIFERGWLPTGVSQTAEGDYRFELHGVRARLICAAAPRFEVVSGWDLAKWQPKTAQRAVPAGSVYWLGELEGTPEALRNLVEQGLWGEPCEDVTRRAEGFNRLTFAAY
jgi:CRISPR-associated protein Cmr3